MVASLPAPELAVCVVKPDLVGCLHLGMVVRELADHALRILEVDGAAVAVFENIDLRFCQASSLRALLDACLGSRIDVQRDVREGRRRHLRDEQVLIFLVRKLEEGERAAAGKALKRNLPGSFAADQEEA